MDQLFVRYADPFSFINGYIQTNRFCYFIDQFIDIRYQDMEQKYKWELYLHKVFDKSFAEWNEENETINNNKNMSNGQIETTVNNAMSILQKFNPS